MDEDLNPPLSAEALQLEIPNVFQTPEEGALAAIAPGAVVRLRRAGQEFSVLIFDVQGCVLRGTPVHSFGPDHVDRPIEFTLVNIFEIES